MELKRNTKTWKRRAGALIAVAMAASVLSAGPLAGPAAADSGFEPLAGGHGAGLLSYKDAVLDLPAPAEADADVDFDFDALFSSFKDRADRMAGCEADEILNDGTADLRPGRTNCLTLTGDALNALDRLWFTEPPSADAPLIVNVDAPGAFKWDVPDAGSAYSSHIIWNFADTDDLVVTGGGPATGTIYAPRAKVKVRTDVDGAVVGERVVLKGGEIHADPFAAGVNPEREPYVPPQEAPEPEAEPTQAKAEEPAAPTTAPPAEQDACAAPVTLANGDFELPDYKNKSVNYPNETAVPGWETNATDNLMEIWANGFNGVPAAEGTQFAELNAYEVSTLYQDLPTTPGQSLNWGLYHRGRNGTDTMRVIIGDPAAQLTPQIPNGQTKAEIADGKAWKHYTGSYTVPEGQTTTRFAFESVSAAGGNPAIGNFLDGIEFGTEPCMGAAKTSVPATGTAVDPGDTITYTVTATHGGGVPATEVFLSDPIPAGTAFVPGSITRTDPDGKTKAVTDAVGFDGSQVKVAVGTPLSETAGGTVSSGETWSVTFQVEVDPDAAPGPVENTGTLTYVDSTIDETETVATETTSHPVDTPDIDITKTVDDPNASPGETVEYTVDIVNNGQTVLTGGTVTDDLSAVLDDAVFNDDADATAGTADYLAPNLTWTGDLDPGEAAKLTYSVTVNDPATGDGVLTNAVTSTITGSNCPPGSPAPECSTSVPLSDIEIAKNASSASTYEPGDTVDYAISVHNPGPADYTGATVTDDLTGIDDDATYNGDAAASDGGPVDLTGTVLTWTGDVPAGQTVLITYSVTIDSPDTGDTVLQNTVVGPPGSNCEAGSTDPDCTTRTIVDTPPVCHDEAYLMTTANGSTSLDRFDLGTGETTKIADLATAAYGITYSPVDGSIIAVDSPYTIKRYDPVTGALKSSKAVTGLPANIAGNAVSASLDGKLLYHYDYQNNRFHTIDLDPRSDTYGTRLATATPSPDVDNVPDLAMHPKDGYLYGVRVDNGALVRMDPATGQWTGFGPKFAATAYGGTFFDAAGNLYAFRNNEGDIYQLDLTASTASAPITQGQIGNPVKVAESSPVSGVDSGSCLSAWDYGDAPDSYGTYKDSGGPRAHFDERLTIGGGVTAEADASATVFGQPLDATGDEDDGVSAWPELSEVTGSYTVQVAVNNELNSAGTLAGWIDFDGDGEFTADERATVPVPAGATSVDLSWTGLSPTAGDTFARLRLYQGTVADPQPTGGFGDSGEIEDHPVTVADAGLAITKSANTTQAEPGDTVEYTVTVENTGAVAYPAAAVTDDLTGVLDDAVYGDDASDGGAGGAFDYTAPNLTWTGPVPVGATVTITYHVTVDSPPGGDGELVNTVTAPGSDCSTGCTTEVPLGRLVIAKTSEASATPLTPGGTLTYTVTIENTGQGDYTGATVTDDLSGVLDDATYNGDATAGAVLEGESLTWTGDVPAGATVTITYSVTVDDPPGGDLVLVNGLVGPDGSTCDPDCGTADPIARLELRKSAEANTEPVRPGSTVVYTVTIENTGQADYTGATVTDDLSGVLDDATYNGDATAGAVLDGDTLTWTGDVPAGQTVTITYSVTVDDPDEGDQVLANALVGPGGSTCVACTTETPVAVLEIAKSNDGAPEWPLQPGATVDYTVTITNTGETAYTGAEVRDDLTKVLDDAAYNGDAQADSGDIDYEVPELVWTGDVAVDQTVTITYSVTVDTPPGGDAVLVNTVTGPPGTNCAEDSGDPACTTRVPSVDLVTSKSADTATAAAGDTVTYTITAANRGEADYPGVTLTDDLTGVLDDAVYNGDATASDDSAVDFDGALLTWTGDVGAGETVTITYSVTLGNPFPAGDGLMRNAVAGPPSGTCDPCEVEVDADKHDFGDAPDRYQTSASDDGAYHQITDALRIGGTITVDQDGNPTPDATGDADDAVVFSGAFVGSTEVVAEVEATNTGAADAVLAGWIDFDRDGDHEGWEDARVTVPARSGTGMYELRWTTTVPDSGTFHSRLRLFGELPPAPARGEAASPFTEAMADRTEAVAAISPVGYGGAGEVQDHVEVVDQAPDTPGTPGTPQTPGTPDEPGAPGEPGDDGQAMPVTGESNGVMALGVLLVALGALALLASRRRPAGR
ncbi:collagen-binding domain-containing protein [Glycomyces sp. NPDC048151]|uniref:DUF7927 domain-containing protein n=1 Tax=Glycomyces sp. NPDC048151 TaxID=3364002 RepID=UPI0037107BE0